ncbi:MAG: response regulator [bacterium]
MSQGRVLVIEDDEDIAQVIEHNLSREGFEVLSSADGENGLALAKSSEPDVVLLDIMLPGLDGMELCRLLKLDPATRSIRIAMVSARGEETDVVLGLGVGADDYIPKPFSPRELVARVKALMRRGPLHGAQTRPVRVVHENLIVDIERHEAFIDGRRVALRATEFRLLYFLVSHPGQVFSRDRLLSEAVAESAFVIDRNVDVHVASIRKKLGEARELIETVRGVGYRMHG